MFCHFQLFTTDITLRVHSQEVLNADMTALAVDLMYHDNCN